MQHQQLQHHNDQHEQMFKAYKCACKPNPAVPLIISSFKALHLVQLGSLLGHLFKQRFEAYK